MKKFLEGCQEDDTINEKIIYILYYLNMQERVKKF